MKGRSLLWSSLVGLAALAPVPALAGSAIAVINVTPTKDGIQIVGQALALVDAKISGELSISRKGQAGSVTTKQGGELPSPRGRRAISRASGSPTRQVTCLMSRSL